MLASLLPGIRETRIPLAVGFAWLVVCWLTFQRMLAHPKPDTIPGDLAAMANTAGPAATGAAVSVAAYLLGVATSSIALWTTARVGRALRRTILARITPEWRRTDRIRPFLDDVVVQRLVARLAVDEEFRDAVRARAGVPAQPLRHGLMSRLRRSPLPRQRLVGDPVAVARDEVSREIYKVVDVEAKASSIEQQLEFVALRLRGQNDQMYDEYDRLQAEADFRIAIFPAIVALFVVLAVRSSPYWMVGAIVAFVLLYTAAGARAKAGILIASSLAAGVITDQVIERLDTDTMPFRGNAPDEPTGRGEGPVVTMSTGELEP